jgi:hypothetical protein
MTRHHAGYLAKSRGENKQLLVRAPCVQHPALAKRKFPHQRAYFSISAENHLKSWRQKAISSSAVCGAAREALSCSRSRNLPQHLSPYFSRRSAAVETLLSPEQIRCCLRFLFTNKCVCANPLRGHSNLAMHVHPSIHPPGRLFLPQHCAGWLSLYRAHWSARRVTHSPSLSTQH